MRDKCGTPSYCPQHAICLALWACRLTSALLDSLVLSLIHPERLSSSHFALRACGNYPSYAAACAAPEASSALNGWASQEVGLPECAPIHCCLLEGAVFGSLGALQACCWASKCCEEPLGCALIVFVCLGPPTRVEPPCMALSAAVSSGEGMLQALWLAASILHFDRCLMSLTAWDCMACRDASCSAPQPDMQGHDRDPAVEHDTRCTTRNFSVELATSRRFRSH